MFSFSMAAREATNSFASRALSSGRVLMMAVVLPPGAAHKSAAKVGCMPTSRATMRS
ncbi:MAG: hypothetical protein K2K93_00095 [Muribaculaceae bacterium]|nr:hypothetical protein [Muribaculaceae bacterium]